MTFDKTARTILPLISGILIYLLVDNLFDTITPLKQIDNSNENGVVVIGEYFMLIVWTIVIIIFQYKIVAPRTVSSVKKFTVWTVIIGLLICLFLYVLLHNSGDIANKEIIVGAIRIFSQIESFCLGNLFCIFLLNKITEKPLQQIE